MEIRPAVFAGSWYPRQAAGCQRQIEEFLEQIDTRHLEGGNYLGGIVPHAGWFYSGAIACNVIALLKSEKPVDVVAVFGMHLHPDSKARIMKSGAWETPLGPLEIDADLAGELAGRFDFQEETCRRFAQDNTIELQLPFVRYFFPHARVVTVGVPPRDESLEIGRTLVRLARQRGLEIRIVGSTDLTHYGYNYGFTPRGTGLEAVEWVRRVNDRRIIDAMQAMDPAAVIDQALTNQNACCSGAAATAIAAARELGAERAEIVAYSTSYDKSPSDSFVGYVGMVMG